MTLGGILYTAIPFNGWYADTEVLRGEKKYSAKLNILLNDQKLTHSVSCLLFLVWWLYVLCLCTYCVDLIDEGRYNMIVPIAKALGMNVEMKAGEPPYYKEDVIAILCKAIYHSYKTSKVALVDHHNLIDMFYDWYEAESVSRGYCPVNWKWVIVSCFLIMNLISTSTLFLTHNILYCMIQPPVSSSTNKAYLGLSHAQEYTLKPAYLVGKGFTELADVHFGKRTIELNWGLFLFRLQVKKWVSQIRARKMVCVMNDICVLLYEYFMYIILYQNTHIIIYIILYLIFMWTK